MQLIYVPFGYLFEFCYKVFGPYANFGLAIILFTLITKIITLPLAIKQQKGTMEMARLKPKLDELNRKYKDDKLKLSEETQKLYKEENYNPLSGCLSAFIQFPIIIGLYGVINAPLTYILHVKAEVIDAAVKILDITKKTAGYQITIINQIDKIRDAAPEIAEQIDKINLDFGFLNLGLRPSMSQISLLWIIPLVAFLSSFLSGWISQKTNPTMQSQGSAGKAMLFTLPFVSLLISFTLPAAIGLYWAISYIITALLTLVINHFYNFYRMSAIEQADIAVKRRKYEEEVKERIKAENKEN